MLSLGLSAVLAMSLASPEATRDKDLDAGLAVVNKVVMAEAKAIDSCVARYAIEQPKLEGRARLTLNIAPTGKVEDAKLSSELPGLRNLRSCLLRVATRLRFPRHAQKNPVELTVDIPVGPGKKLKLKSSTKNPPKAKTSAPAPNPQA